MTKDKEHEEEVSQEMNSEEYNELLRVRKEKLEELRNAGVYPYGTRFDTTHHNEEILNAPGEYVDKDKVVKIAGRIMAKRGHGKASFANLQDSTGQIQIYARLNDIGEEKYNIFKDLDIGDIVGISGTVFKTRTGETTVAIKELDLLSKSLRPLPEKWHGLKDVDLRYRQRYLDLIVNPEVKQTFELRSKIIQNIRGYLINRGFLEVETPMMQPIPGGAAARPFITYHNALEMELYLRIAPELYLKRLIVGGFEKIFEINRNFRNEGVSTKHNPEFTMLELYQAYADYYDMMDLTEDLISSLVQRVFGTTRVSFQGQEIDMSTPWKRVPMLEAIKEMTGINFNDIKDVKGAGDAAESLGIDIEESDSWGTIVNKVYEEKVEPNFVNPAFVTDYPVEISPLAKRQEEHPELTYRFELVINGWEIANAFSELNDPIDQKERFLEQLKKRSAGDDEAHMMDEDYINALEHGMPPAGGLGIGIDRLVMLLTDSPSIKDVILFPHMRPRS